MPLHLQPASIGLRTARQILVTTVILTGCISRVQGVEPTIDRTVLATHLHEWRQQFASIRIIARVWHPDDFKASHPNLKPEDELGKRYFSRSEFVWADIGGVREILTVFKEGDPWFRDGRGGNSEQPWAAETKFAQDVDRWDLIQIYRNNPDRPLSFLVVCPATFGLWDSSGLWFDERMLAAKDLHFSKPEEIDGHTCQVVKWTMQVPGLAEGILQVSTLWVDPENGYLPRKCQLQGKAPGKDIWPIYTWIVNEFTKVDGQLSFPASGRIYDSVDAKGNLKGSGVHWVIDRVVLNESFSKEYFLPPKPQPGTRIIDYSDRKAYRAPPSKLKGSQPSPSAPFSASDKANKTLALPTRSSWALWRILGIGVVTSGFVLLWRNRGRGTH